MFTRGRTTSLRRPSWSYCNRRSLLNQFGCSISPLLSWNWRKVGSSVGERLQSRALLLWFPKSPRPELPWRVLIAQRLLRSAKPSAWRYSDHDSCRDLNINQKPFSRKRLMKPNLIEMQNQWSRTQSEHRAATPRKCPVCAGTNLVPIQRQGIEIDCCPTCRGVWLDRGELERLIVFATAGTREIHIRRAPIPGGKDDGVPASPAVGHHCYPGQPMRQRAWLREMFE
jgi:uncharacterized protein